MRKILLVTAALTTPLFSQGEELSNQQIMQEIKLLKQQVHDLELKLSKANAENNKKIKQDKQLDKKNDAGNKADSNITSSDLLKNIKIGGKIEFDSAYINNKNEDNVFGSRMRTASLSLDGAVPGDLKYKLEVDFAGDKVNLKKAYFDYCGFEMIKIRAGRFAQDFGMNSDSKFPEEAPALSQRGGVASNDGVRVSAAGERWYSSLGFGSTLLDKTANKNNFKNIFFRQTYAPVISEKFVLHTGFSGILYKSKDKNGKIEYKTGYDTKYYDNAINYTLENVKNVNVIGVDLGTIYGPFSIQGEYVKSLIKTDDNNQPKKHINGSYIQMAYSLTGEQRSYNPSDNGNFLSLEPKEEFSLKNGGLGAWELAFRYNKLDLENFKGGKMNSFSSSINWYWNKNFHIKFSYIKGSSVKYENNTTIKKKPNIFILRASLNF